MTIRIKLPGGTLKIKTLSRLRHYERDRKVPLFRLGGLYFIWQKHRVKPAA